MPASPLGNAFDTGPDSPLWVDVSRWLGADNSPIAGPSTWRAGRAVRLSQKPETNRALTLVDTGTFVADHGAFAGGELGFSHGPFLLQAEGGTLKWQGPGADPRFSGWSAQASWRLTGESRPYDPKAGVFGRVAPARSWTDGGPGAFEVGVRMTGVDLNDARIAGGRMTTEGVVMNWYPGTRLRLGANLIHARVERPGVVDLEQTLLTLRAAADW